MKRLVEFFIERTFLVNLLSAFVILAGLVAAFNMKRDLVPQWQMNTISIDSSLPGASPQQIEHFVTYPIEEAIQNFAGIDEIVSKSREGISDIDVKIKPDLDPNEINDLYQNVKSAVEGVRTTLPEDLENLRIVNEKLTSFWFSSLSVLGFDTFNSEHRGWLKSVIDKLERVPGIVRVTDRMDRPNLFIQFNQDALARYHMTSGEVEEVLRLKLRPLPLGSFSQGEKEIGILIDNRVSSLDEIKKMVVKGNSSGSIIRLGDVSDVRLEIEEQKYKQFTNGEKSVSVILFKDLETDTLDTKERVEKLLKDINKDAPTGLKIQVTDDGPAYIERQLNVLNNNALMGVVLVVLVLFLFLGLKTSLMTTFGLPLAYFATFIVLSSMGMKIDLISVVGMILILGILVDDAIIVSEQYMQFLEQGHSPKESAWLAVKKTAIPILGTVLTTIVAFSPILLANDGLSNFLEAIPWVVIAALGMSLLESFFVLPNHLAHFVKKPVKSREGGLFVRFKRGYAALLKYSLKFRYPLMVALVAFSAWTFWFAKENVPFKFNLRIGSEKVRILAALKESDSVEETEKKLKPIWALLKEIDSSEYSHIEGNIGYAYISGEEYNGVRYANIALRFNQTHPDIDGAKERIQKFLEEKLPPLKTDDFEILQVDRQISGHEKGKDHTLSVKVIGKDDVSFQNVVSDIKTEARKLEQTKEVYIDPKLSIETWSFQINEKGLQTYDLSPVQLSEQVRQFVTKKKVYDLRYKGEMLQVYTFFEDNKKLTYEKLQSLPVLINRGRRIPLSELGTWRKTQTLREIVHNDLERTLAVDVKYDEEKIKKEKFQEILASSIKPLKEKYPTLKFVVEDADEQAKKNKESISQMALYCVFLIMLVLAIVLNSLVQPLLIGTAIPFGVVGVVWAFYFHDSSLDVMALVGIIGMAGVVVNDSLIMVDTINGLRKDHGVLGHHVIIDGAVSRLRPIILTSITTLGGVFPMAYGLGGDSGFTKPLALAMGWGLFFATFVTLIFIPALLSIQYDIIKLGARVFNLNLLNTSPNQASGKTSLKSDNDLEKTEFLPSPIKKNSKEMSRDSQLQ